MSDTIILKESKVNLLDFAKIMACVLIIGSHCLPLFESDIANYYYGQWFFRFCVPFFFICSGYYFSKMNFERKIKYIKRIALIYLLSTSLYLPAIIRSGDIRFIITSIIIGYDHLWYLSALLIGLLLFLLFERVLNNKICILFFLIILGIIFDEYYKFFDSIFLNNVASILLYFGGSNMHYYFAFQC